MYFIKEQTKKQLAEWLETHKQPAFRLSQIQDWIFKKLAVSFDEMVNLPKALREELSEEFLPFSLDVVTRQADDDRTVKWLSRLHDGHTIETVLIRAPKRNTVCISTQVGCQVHCIFCATGKQGFVRNLEVAEIVDQVVLASREIGELVSNVVVMGMGEPLHNLQNLIPALEMVCSPEGFGLGARHVTISTSGIPHGIRQLADLQRPWNLAVSLHAANNALRARIIPPKFRFRIEDIQEAVAYYRERTGRMPTIEYVLVENLNASAEDASALADVAHDFHAKVNLIPCNSDEPRFAPPPPEACEKFLSILTKRNLQATLRMRKGKNIQAACGQLRQAEED
ncbi:MAG: 23S rRNA (adenine(2503)-C(2))-methyltransferase RlmN [Lentisphaeria bacterium]|nr:23S rRNA (adenine(2503)-C(2))-methyltransferase RlmN [Lentisphaeria bacterium]